MIVLIVYICMGNLN